VLIASPSGGQIPLGDVASLSPVARDRPMIRDEDGGQLTGYVYLNLDTTDYGGSVVAPDRVLRSRLVLPTGLHLPWSGEYEFERGARSNGSTNHRAAVLFAIFTLLYLLFQSVGRKAVVRSSSQWSTPSRVGFGAAVVARLPLQRRGVGSATSRLFGIAVENGGRHGPSTCMRPLDDGWRRASRARLGDIVAAAIEGPGSGLRPKLMTVQPSLGEPGAHSGGRRAFGSDVMKPIAAPIVGEW